MHHSGTTRTVLAIYGVIFLIFSYIPIIATGLASLADSPYLSFPLRTYSLAFYVDAVHDDALVEIFLTTLKIAFVVSIVSMVMGFLGGLAFGRYQWRWRKTFQKFVLLPIFFPQPVLGLALLIWFNTLGFSPNWVTAVIALLVWIGPIATLIVAIQAYSFDPALEEAARDMNATTWQTLTKVTLPILWPSTMAAGIFGFLLSWGNFALALYTTGIDRTIPVWAYAKMIGAYTPVVPVMGTISLLVSVVFLIAVFIVFITVKMVRSRKYLSEPSSKVTEDKVPQSQLVRKEASDV